MAFRGGMSGLRPAQGQETYGETRLSAGVAVRRLLDIGAAVIGLICLSPIMGFTMLAIFLDSGRPVFFSQTRLGYGGRHFRLHKFRKFQCKERSGGRPITMQNDPRLSRVGKLLERTKLDELPQLWDVLKGDMSIVGPRPESLDFEDCFVGLYRRVLDYKPGVFGPSQAIFRSEGSLYDTSTDPEQFYRDILFPTKARIDLAYYPNRSLLADAGWVARGVLAVFGWSALPQSANSALGRCNHPASRKP